MSREVWIGIVAAVLIMGGFFLYQYLHKSVPAVETTAATAAPPVPAEPSIQYPVPEPKTAEPSAPALPALNESDAAMHAELSKLFAAAPIESFLVPTHIIQNVVATVNSLDGTLVPLRLRPLTHVPGFPVTTTTAEGIFLSAANTKRYAPYMVALKALDARKLAEVYLHFYPLFQQAYIQLGYPKGYWNDRLINVIDHLLVAPEVQGPIKLVQPNVLFEYADPALEKLSSGHKLLIRMGPENAALIKAKLTEFRGAIVGQVSAAH